MNNFHKLFISTVLVVIWGCGVHQNPDKEDQIFIPEKISVEIPELLSSTSNEKNAKQQKIEEEFFGGEATGYQDVQNYIAFLEDTIKGIKFNIIIGNSSIVKIQSICKSIPIDEICTIPANTLFVTIDKSLIEQYETFFPDSFDIDEDSVGKEVPYDLVEFVKHDENSTYQYDIQLKMTEIFKALYTKEYISDANVTSVVQNVKWSDNNNTILSSISYGRDDNTSIDWTVHYENRPDIEEHMHLHDKVVENIPEESSMVNFDLTSKYDVNETSIYKFNEINEKFSVGEGTLSLNTYSAYGELTKGNGFQTFSQTEIDETFGDSKIRTQEIFTNSGELIATTYCSSFDEACNIFEPSSWYIESEDEISFEHVEAVSFDELNITSSILKEGEYFLLPLNYDTSLLTAQAVLDDNVGTFIVFKGLNQGALYDRTYLNDLETLQIVYARYNDNLAKNLSQKSSVLFEVLLESEKPKIQLF